MSKPSSNGAEGPVFVRPQPAESAASPTPADDVRRLLDAAGASGHPYAEVQSEERRQAATTRWPLLHSTQRVLARRRLTEQPGGEETTP